MPCQRETRKFLDDQFFWFTVIRYVRNNKRLVYIQLCYSCMGVSLCICQIMQKRPSGAFDLIVGEFDAKPLPPGSPPGRAFGHPRDVSGLKLKDFVIHSYHLVGMFCYWIRFAIYTQVGESEKKGPVWSRLRKVNTLIIQILFNPQCFVE